MQLPGVRRPCPGCRDRLDHDEREEAPVLIREQFDRYDTDHDGFITMEDAQQWD
jgi:Ca2+-binding EF-hand superfamily protein